MILTTLDDTQYRRLLQAKGLALTNTNFTADDVYEIIDTLVGQAACISLLNAKDGLGNDISNEIELKLDSTKVNAGHLVLIDSAKVWFMPMTCNLRITLV